MYLTVRDFRIAMRDPHDSSRAHAICRKLCGGLQRGKLYAALYWAACSVTSQNPEWRWYRRCFARELNGGNDELSRSQRKLWIWAVCRVRALRSVALTLKATINGTTVAYPSNLGDIQALYPKLSEGEAIVIRDEQGTEIERHVRRNGEVVAEECGVDYDA